MSKTVTMTVEALPPSVNHYVEHSAGRHFKTAEAKAFAWAMMYGARDCEHVRGKRYEIEITYYLGKGMSGDIDNLPKCVLDGLAMVGVIDRDSKVKDLNQHLRRDWERPRTEITITAEDKEWH